MTPLLNIPAPLKRLIKTPPILLVLIQKNNVQSQGFIHADMVLTSDESEPTFWRAELFDKANQAEPSFFLQMRGELSQAFCSQNRAKPSFRFSKIEQFLTFFRSII